MLERSEDWSPGGAAQPMRGGRKDRDDGRGAAKKSLNPSGRSCVYSGEVFEAFLGILGWAIVACGAVAVVFLVLLAMPRSPMRNWLTELVMRLMATGAAGAYALSPIDFIPDFIPVLGQMDDVAVLLLLAYYWWTMLNPAKPGPTPRPYAGRRPAAPGQGPVIDIQADDIS